jgi:uncharacterized membrane protein YjjP (DUF1212 family)
MRRKRKTLKNEWLREKPTLKEIAAAQRLARRVDKKLLDLMEAQAK